MDLVFVYLVCFFALKAGLIISTFFLINSSKTVHSVFILISAFIFASAISILLGASFLGMLMVIVYVGAVSVLFLFVTMMLGMQDQPFYPFQPPRLIKKVYAYNPDVAAAVFAFIFYVLCVVFSLLRVSADLSSVQTTVNEDVFLVNHLSDLSNVFTIGSVLYTYYFFPFLLSSIVLLVAMIGAIFLTSELGSFKALKQDISNQIETQESQAFYLTGATIHSVKKTVKNNLYI